MADQIEREVVIVAPQADVWEVVVSPGWLADEVELDPVPGGEARFVTDGAVRTGWVEEAIAPAPGTRVARLAFWWSADGEPATRVEIVLEADGDDVTRLWVSETRPLEVLDVVGIPLPGAGGASHGPALVAA